MVVWMSSDIVTIFETLIFGEGAFLGFIMAASIMALVTVRIKIMAILFCVISGMLSIYCFNNIASNTNLIWVAILYGINIIMLIIIALSSKGSYI
jgi:hypothetical protein